MKRLVILNNDLRSLSRNKNSALTSANYSILSPKLLYVNDYANQFLDLKLSTKELEQRKLSTQDIINLDVDFSSPRKQVAQLEVETNRQGKENKKEKRYLDVTLQPMFSPKSNKHLGSTVVLHDVTERQQAELELQNFDRQKSEFFAGISHEFRTPLTLSLGNLDDVLSSLDAQLEKKKNEENRNNEKNENSENSENTFDKISAAEIKTSLTYVKNNNKRLLTLVNQLLELSRLDTGSLQIKPVLLHMDRDLPRLLANFESLAEMHNIRIHLLLDDKTTGNPSLYFDLDAFEKVIINLMSNALKSIQNGGDVYIQVQSLDDQHCQLSIRDTGCGISADALPKVFEMFYSHQSDNTNWPQGVGVGLSLVKQLLNQHGATIKVSSVIDEGTTLTVKFRKGFTHLPDGIGYQVDSPGHTLNEINNKNENENESVTHLPDDEENKMTSTAIHNRQLSSELEEEKVREGSEQLVLLVEDNAEMRAYIRKHLTTHFRLLEAEDGEEGFALAMQAMPDLILSDVMMPKLNGYDLCKKLKTNPQTSHIPVLLLTAKSAQSDKLEGLEIGADDYLGKPFDVKELTLRMRNLIASRRIIKQFYQSNGLQKVIDSPVVPKREKVFLDSLQTYVNENIDKSDIQVSDLAKAVHMSERSFGRKLKMLTGDTPKHMLLAIRLEYATELLRSTNDSISRLSYKAGFSDASHFTRTFKAQYSKTPTAYRKQERKNMTLKD